MRSARPEDWCLRFNFHYKFNRPRRARCSSETPDGESLGVSMAISFREFPWFIQALVFCLLAVLIFVAGEYVPMSPVPSMRDSLQQHHTQDSYLDQQVAQLQVYERRYPEFKLEMAALEKQLHTL